MLRIRLTRTGKKKQPTYRFVVAEHSAPIKGKFIEILGHYNPRTKPKTIVIDKEKAKGWMEKGAKPSSTVADLFVINGILKKSDIPKKTTLKRPKKADLKKEKEAKPKKPAEGETATAPQATEEKEEAVTAKAPSSTEVTEGKQKESKLEDKITKEKQEEKDQKKEVKHEDKTKSSSAKDTPKDKEKKEVKEDKSTDKKSKEEKSIDKKK